MAAIAVCGFLSACSGTPRRARVEPGVSEPTASRVPSEAAMVGVSLAGGEFGQVPGVFGRNYTYPREEQLAYLRSKGFGVARLPVRWERIQRALMAPLDETEMARIDAVVACARKHGIKLLLDLHNYARYQGELLGTQDVPNEAFAELWRQLAARYGDEEAVFAYGLMNEPHDTKGLWPAAAQAAVDAIRSVDGTHTIAVCGDGWSGAHSWQTINKDLHIKDPEGNLVYEAHQYFDRDNSGAYKQDYDESRAHPTIGVERLKPFADWLKEHDARGFIGEFGVPDDDPRWLVVLDNFLAAMKTSGIGGTYWAAGPWWGKYRLAVEPRDGKDRPQMAVLGPYAGTRTGPSERPWLAAAAEAEERAAKAAESGRANGPGTVHDLGRRKESYHYSNEGSEFASDFATDGDRRVRKITYRHRGKIAWVGVGLYFGALDCKGHSAFRLGVRSEKPIRLEVKAYHAADQPYTAVFPVGTGWQELLIPFSKLKRGERSFSADGKLLKIEFQPNPDHNGNCIFLGPFRLTADE